MKISNSKFLLKEPKSDKKTLISLFVRFNNQRVVYSTGESIAPSAWDFKEQRAKISKKYPENSNINHWLIKMNHEVQSIFRNLKIDGIVPTPTMIKEELSKKLNDKPAPKKQTLFDFIESYLEQSKGIKTERTLQAYRTLVKHLKNYSEIRNQNLGFDDITMEFYNYFTQYLTCDLQFSQNTIAKYIKILKVFLNAATESGLNTNLQFKSKKFKRPTEEVTKIYLTTDEIQRLYDLDLKDNKRLDKIRDLFIIGCATGLRFSDFSTLQPENINGELIKIKTKKTGEIVAIPFKGKLKTIFKKYNGTFPISISNQNMNAGLKELGAKASLDNTIVVRKLKGGEMEEKHYKKHELLTTHCARRSFATNAYLAGLPSINIMKITGHKSEKVFREYIRFSQEENALKLKDHPFFN